MSAGGAGPAVAAATNGPPAVGAAPTGAAPVPGGPPPILVARGLGKRYGARPARLGRLARRLGPGAADGLRPGGGEPDEAGPPPPGDPRRDAAGGLWAVRGVDVELRAGESLGLVGRNGSGKSTLLRLLAGTARPSEGSALARAPLASLLQLGAGFHDLETGRENAQGWLVLQGGMTRREARRAACEIERFAGIGAYFDRPLRTCSAGMQVRVAFATAAMLQPRILVTDEVLAVGDEEFQRRCNRWFDRFLAGGGSLVLCAHDLFQVQRLCERTIWLDLGRVRETGATRDVVREYRRHAGNPLPDETGAAAPDAGTLHAPGESAGLEFEVVDMHLRDANGAEVREVAPGDDLVVEVDIRAPAAVPQVHVSLVRADGVPVYGVSSDMDHARPDPLGGDLHRFRLRFPALSLLPGGYLARAHALDETGMRLYDTVEIALAVRGAAAAAGLVAIDARWSR